MANPATAKYFTNSPERVVKLDPRTGVKTTHLIYSYRNMSRVDVWQGIKDPLRKIIKGIKSNEEQGLRVDSLNI